MSMRKDNNRKVKHGERQFKGGFIPIEIRNGLRSVLSPENSEMEKK